MAKNKKKNINKAASTKDMKEFGVSGLKRWSGEVDEEFLTELKGDKAIQIYKQMGDNDPIVGGILAAIDVLIKNVDWTVQPYDEKDSQSLKDAEFVAECWQDTDSTPEDFLSEVFSMLQYGFAPFELVYKRRLGRFQADSTKKSKYNDGKIGWRKFGFRSQDTLYKWEFDKNGTLKGMYQQDPNTYNIVFIPIEKMLLFRTSTFKNNPQGRSLLRRAYRPWFLKKHVENIEAIAVERDLVGVPIAYVPPEITSSDAEADEKAIYENVKKIVRDLRTDEQAGVVLPSLYDEDGNQMMKVELLSTNGSRLMDTDKIIRRYDQRISQTMLADFFLIGHENVGSKAMIEDKSSFFLMAINGWLKSFTSIMNNIAIPALFDVNGWVRDFFPNMVHAKLEKEDIEQFMNALEKATRAGVPIFPSEERTRTVLEKLNLPADGADGE